MKAKKYWILQVLVGLVCCFSPVLFANNSTVDEEYDPSQTIAECTRAIEVSPNDPNNYMMRGRAYGHKREYDKAILDFTKSIELNPNDPNVYVVRGSSYGCKGNYDQAILDYAKAIELNPDAPQAYDLRGLTYVIVDDLNKAISDYNKVVELRPDDPNAYSNRGEAYFYRRNYDQAITDYTKAIELNPNDPDIYYSRGKAYLKKADYEKAIVDYRKIIELNPDDPNVYFCLGSVYSLKGNHDLAISNFNKAIETNPNDPGAYIARACSYRFKGNYNQAIADYTKVVKLNPNGPKNYWIRGRAYGKKRQYDKAITDFSKAIAISPTYTNAYHDRTIYELAKKDYVKAWQDIHKIQSLEKQVSPEVLKNLREALGTEKPTRITDRWSFAKGVFFAKECQQEAGRHSGTKDVLSGIEGIFVMVEDLKSEAKRYGLTKHTLQADTELQLRQHGIKVVTEQEPISLSQRQEKYLKKCEKLGTSTADSIVQESEERFLQCMREGALLMPSNVPYLGINVNVVISEEKSVAAYNIGVEIREAASLLRDKRFITATVWSKGSTGLIPLSRLMDIRKDVRDHVDAFINDYLAANPTEIRSVPMPVTKDERVFSLTTTTPQKELPAEGFQYKYYIAGTIRSKEGLFALIGDKVVREGDTIDGVKVVRIREGIVEFDKNGKQWTQRKLETPSPNWR